MSTPAAVSTAVFAVGAVLTAMWVVLVKREERRRERARKMIAVREAALKAKGIDGTHEACEVPEREELIFDRYASRYASLGQDMTKGTST